MTINLKNFLSSYKKTSKMEEFQETIENDLETKEGCQIRVEDLKVKMEALIK